MFITVPGSESRIAHIRRRTQLRLGCAGICAVPGDVHQRRAAGGAGRRLPCRRPQDQRDRPPRYACMQTMVCRQRSMDACFRKRIGQARRQDQRLQRGRQRRQPHPYLRRLHALQGGQHHHPHRDRQQRAGPDTVRRQHAAVGQRDQPRQPDRGRRRADRGGPGGKEHRHAGADAGRAAGNQPIHRKSADWHPGQSCQARAFYALLPTTPPRSCS